MTTETRRPRTDAEKAVLCVLRTALHDPRGLGRYIGPCANTFELLCAAEAAYTGESAETVAQRYGEEAPSTENARAVTRVTFTVELDEIATADAITHACNLIEDEDLISEAPETDADRAAMTFCRALAGATVEAQ